MREQRRQTRLSWKRNTLFYFNKNVEIFCGFTACVYRGGYVRLENVRTCENIVWSKSFYYTLYIYLNFEYELVV